MGFWGNLFGVGQGNNKNRDQGALLKSVRDMCGDLSERELLLATGYAGLLGRVAYADTDFSAEEVEKISRILEHRTGIGRSCAASVVTLLETRRVELLTLEDYLYTRMLNEVAGDDEKRDLLRGLFEVAAADESISIAEDSTIARLSDALRLPRSEYVALKQEFREHLAVLKE